MSTVSFRDCRQTEVNESGADCGVQTRVQSFSGAAACLVSLRLSHQAERYQGIKDREWQPSVRFL